MKKLFVLAVAVAITQWSFAQTEQSKTTEPGNATAFKQGHKKGMHAKREMMQQLNLTTEQKAKLKEMNAGNREKKQAIMSDSKLTDEQKKAQLTAIKKAQAENMQSVLTDEQKTKMKEMKMNRKEGKMNRKDRKSNKVEAAPAPQNQ